ncbi:MAG: hypothetical protein ABL878_08120 [Burkholderiales bacterium]
MKIPIRHLAPCRSRNKGNSSNISVIASESKSYPVSKAKLASERFKEHYAPATPD